MSRFYVPKENVKGDKIIVEGDEAHHIIDVMRLKEGDEVVVFDGTGKEYKGNISSANSRDKMVEVSVLEVREGLPEAQVSVTLAQSIPKKDKMDYLLQKATELGVRSVIPIITDRTIVRPDASSSKKKRERWQKIALGAAKQCGRCDVPEVESVIEYKLLRERFDSFDVVLFACLSESTLPVKDILKEVTPGKVLLVIGPEGGFSPEEIEMAAKSGCRLVSFGKRVLKSDTAGLFALAVLNYEFSI